MIVLLMGLVVAAVITSGFAAGLGAANGFGADGAVGFAVLVAALDAVETAGLTVLAADFDIVEAVGLEVLAAGLDVVTAAGLGAGFGAGLGTGFGAGL